MIIVSLKGGLGNQMFQYAAGRTLALKLNTPLLLDLSFLRAEARGQYTQRHYELEQFNIKARIAEAGDLANFKNKSILKRFFGKAGTCKIFSESGSAYNPAFAELHENTLLDGFWQSEKYFGGIRAHLLEDFTPAFSFSEGDKQIISGLKTSNSVSIHVRRGDYINLKSASEYHGVCGVDYYNKAIKKIKELVNDPKFFIFSDDLDWCRDNFKHIQNVQFVKSETPRSASDLLMMSYCKHNIIANSSYSWWAAWLNQHENKMVIAPSQWFAPHVPVNKDLIPSAWIKI